MRLIRYHRFHKTPIALAWLFLVLSHGFLFKRTRHLLPTLTSDTLPSPEKQRGRLPPSLGSCCVVASKSQKSVDDEKDEEPYLKDSSDKKLVTAESEEDDKLVISDAEALLACYSYLKRTKRLGNWTQFERRQIEKEAAPPHYFWEFDELLPIVDDDGESQGNGGTEDDDDDYPDYGSSYELDKEPVNMMATSYSSAMEIWSGEFTSLPSGPSETRVRRSQAAKKFWKDASFRKKWYAKRWGSRSKFRKKGDNEGRNNPSIVDSVVNKNDKNLEMHLRALPQGFLGSHELSEMTEEEITLAIEIYLKSSSKKVRARKQTLAKRRNILEEQMITLMEERPIRGGGDGDDDKEATKDDSDGHQLNSTTTEEKRKDRDSLFKMDEKILREAQERRAKQAKQRYAQRLLNEQKARGSSPIPGTAYRSNKSRAPRVPKAPISRFKPSRATPQDALLRMKQDLDQGMIPASKDIKIVLKPLKLGKRKDLFRRILDECFDLRGKCIPTDFFQEKGGNQTTSNRQFVFVTSCAIGDLGAFVLKKVEEHESSEADTTAQQ